MTPLFPDDNKKIAIKQGQTGDCYLLAVLDCILNSGKEGRNLIASMFQENTDESVTLRIPHNGDSKYLLSNNIFAKYQYQHNTDTNTDEITISKADLERMDENTTQISPGKYTRGVQSNSLAVKILEHISSYYFATPWDQPHSIAAHDQDERYKGNEAAVFVSALLGIKGRYTRDYDEIIKLKTINPEQPLYIEMYHGKPDEDGRIHDYHALRVKRIEANDTSYDFVLVNPWDNNKEETYSLEEIKKREFHFCELNFDKPKQKLNQSLLKCSRKIGSYIYQHPELLALLHTMHKNGWENLCSKSALKSCVALHKTIPYVQSLLDLLNADEQQTMLSLMCFVQKSKATFIKQLLRQFPRISILEELLKQDSDHRQIGDILVDLTSTEDPDVYRLIKSQEAFNAVVNAAINHKAQQPNDQGQPYGQQDAQSFVEEGLFNYFFKIDDNSAQITRNAGLRALCSAKIFTMTHIKSWLVAPEALVAKAIAVVMNSPIMFSEVTKYIESSAFITIKEDFLNKILGHVITTDPQQLFEGLKKLHSLDAWLAKGLFPLLAAKIERGEPGSFQRLVARIAREPSSAFNAWFIQLQTELIPHAAPLAQQWPEQIRPNIQAEINKSRLAINNAPTPTFKNFLRISDIESAQDDQILQLKKKTISQNLYDDKFSLPNEVTKALEEKVREVEQAALLAKQKVMVRNEGNIFLAQINFNAQLDIIDTLALELENKALSDDNYAQAAVSARILHNQLLTAQEHLLTSEQPRKKSILQFTDSCIEAIDHANTVLEEHRGWKEALEILASILVSIVTLLSANLVTGRWRLFSSPTHSATITNEVKEVFNHIPVGTCGR